MPEIEFLCMLTDKMDRDTHTVWMTDNERADHIRNSLTDYYLVDPIQSRVRGIKETDNEQDESDIVTPSEVDADDKEGALNPWEDPVIMESTPLASLPERFFSDTEFDIVSHPEGWIEERENFGKNNEIGPRIPMDFDEDSCPHGNHIMSSCAECNIEQMDYAIADSIIWDVLGFKETPDGSNEPKYSFAWSGKWIVVLVDKGTDTPDIVCIMRDSNDKWIRGALKSIESLK